MLCDETWLAHVSNVGQNDAPLQRDPVSPDVPQRLSKGSAIFMDNYFREAAA